MQYIFHWADYVVFASLLISSAVLGLYHGLVVQKRQRKAVTSKFIPKNKCHISVADESVSSNVGMVKSNCKLSLADEVNGISGEEEGDENRNGVDLFLGGGGMSIFPVTMSIIATSMSAISLLGTMAEVYLNGIQYMLIGLTYFVAYPVTAEVFLPVFYRLRIVSIHQYLELRFSRTIRQFVSFVYLFQMILYISVVLYAPAVAFSQVTGLAVWITILSTGLVCTFYTAIGGLRAVIWADVLQMIFVIVALMGILIHGIYLGGGLTEVWTAAKDSGRLRLADFNPNPFLRHTFWTISIGGIGMVLSVAATNQTSQQRYLACKTLKAAKTAVWLNLPLTFFFMVMLIAGGVVCYGLQAGCDPKKAGQMTRYDQILPYTVMKMWHNIPGLPGVFLSCVFAAALSTVSSGVNSLSTVLIEDIIPKHWRPFQPKWISFSSKVVGILIGLLTIVLAFLGEILTPTVLQLSLSIFGLLGGPILALFSQGLFMPFVNSKGAFSGLVMGLCTSVVIFSVSAFTTNVYSQSPLPLSIDSCQMNSNATMTLVTRLPTNTSTISISNVKFYHISYLYYTAVTTLLSCTVAVIVSGLTGFNSLAFCTLHLYYPPAVRLLQCLPLHFQRKLQLFTEESLNTQPELQTNLTESQKGILEDYLSSSRNLSFNALRQHSVT